MDRVFSVDDIADEFWSPHASPIRLHDDADVNQPYSSATAPSSSKMMGMNRSSSEFAFQRFLQEADHKTTTLQSDDVVAISGNDRQYSVNQHREMAAPAALGGPPLNIPLDSEEYQAFLKSRLEVACAAVALTRAPEFAAAAADIGSCASNLSLNEANEWDSSKSKVKDSSGPIGVPPLPARKSVVQVRSTTSGSSGEQSDDDEAEGVTEATQNMDPADAKRMRRMLSNRESARRSRRRKQDHLTELEMQVSQSGVENSSLLKRLTEINQKYNEAAVDNRVLKADLETLRAKVKMAEESVKSVTGLNSLFRAMSEICTTSMPSFASSPSDTVADVAVPVQDDPKQQYYHSPSNNYHLTDHTIPNGSVEIPPRENVPPNTTAANTMGGSVSMKSVASLEHLQKRIREKTSFSGTLGTREQ